MVVMDSFALPVEGTETRVNAQAQGYEYMTAYIESAKQVTIIVKIFKIPTWLSWQGWSPRKCHRLVPLPPWIWLLALWNWRLNTNAQPKLPGTYLILDLLHRTCRTFIYTDITTSVRIHLWRSSSIQSEPYLLAKSTLEPSEPIPRGTSLQTTRPQSIRQFPWTKLRTLEFIASSITGAN